MNARFANAFLSRRGNSLISKHQNKIERVCLIFPGSMNCSVLEKKYGGKTSDLSDDLSSSFFFIPCVSAAAIISPVITNALDYR